MTYMIDPGTKVHGANVGPIWGRQDTGGPHVGPMNLAIWDSTSKTTDQHFVDMILYVAHWVFLSRSNNIVMYRKYEKYSFEKI